MTKKGKKAISIHVFIMSSLFKFCLVWSLNITVNAYPARTKSDLPLHQHTTRPDCKSVYKN